MTVTRVIDADGHIVEDNAAIGQRMPDLYKRWKYAHGLMSKVPWFPSIGALYYAPAGSPRRKRGTRTRRPRRVARLPR